MRPVTSIPTAVVTANSKRNSASTRSAVGEACSRQIATGIIDAVEIPGRPPFGRQNHNAAVVRELIASGIVQVRESDRLSQPVDGRLIARQKVPTVLRVRPAIVLHVSRLLSSGQRR